MDQVFSFTFSRHEVSVLRGIVLSRLCDLRKLSKLSLTQSFEIEELSNLYELLK